MLNEIDFLLSTGYESKTVANIQDDIMTFRLENMEEDEKEMMNDMAKDFFNNMGVDMDMEDFNFEDFHKPPIKQILDLAPR